jgi:hypothetical protein
MPAGRGLARLADVADRQRRDGFSQPVVRREYSVIPMPVLPRRRHEVRQPVQELKRREFDDAIGSRPRGLPAAAGPDPVGGFVSGQHVADAGCAAVWAMWRPLQDGQTPRPLQLAIGRAGHPWPRPAGQPMGTPRVPMAAKPGSAGPPRRTPCGTSCRPRGRSRSRGCRTRDSRGVRPRRSPARAARQLIHRLPDGSAVAPVQP